MSAASAACKLSQFALDVEEGLSDAQKWLPARCFYDELGSTLFEAITKLPEYGLTRADERLLRSHAPEMAATLGPVRLIAELGSGSGTKTRHILEAFRSAGQSITYCPIDVSVAALEVCERQLQDVARIVPIVADWTEGLAHARAHRAGLGSTLVLYLGSSIGNLNRDEIPPFLRGVRSHMRSGDHFLLGADLIKSARAVQAAYDDATGVTAAFNLNVLGRINRELNANFNLRAFRHRALWNAPERRVEMHLVSECDQEVHIGALQTTFHFGSGETIWTESSHKFSVAELERYANATGFHAVATWTDVEWPFAETLWQAAASE